MTLRARQGTCLILSDEGVEEIGGIVIPEYVRRIGRPHGILIQAGTDDPLILACLGLRVLVRTAVSFDYAGEHYLFANLDQILAVVDKEDSIRIIDPIERCQWCRSAGEGNMLMDSNGYCVQCGKNRYGEHKSARQLKVSDDEKEAFGHTPDYYANRENAKGKIVSYAGQKKRAAAVVPAKRKLVSYEKQSHDKTAVLPSDGKIISAASLKKRSRY